MVGDQWFFCLHFYGSLGYWNWKMKIWRVKVKPIWTILELGVHVHVWCNCCCSFDHFDSWFDDFGALISPWSNHCCKTWHLVSCLWLEFIRKKTVPWKALEKTVPWRGLAQPFPISSDFGNTLVYVGIVCSFRYMPHNTISMFPITDTRLNPRSLTWWER